MIIELPAEIAFFVPALLAVPAWLGVRRDISIPEKLPASDAFHISKGNILLFVIMLIVLFWLDSMCSTIHSEIVNAGIDEADVIYMVLGFVLPAIGFLLYGFIHDKGRERLGFICGMGLLLLGVILELMPTDTQSVLSLPMVFADGLGGTYTEFFVLTLPVFLLYRTKRPVFVASLGVIINLVSSALKWVAEYWLPETLIVSGSPLLVSTAVSAVLFILLSFFLFERHREKTLAAALYSLLYDGENAETLQTENIPPKTEERSMTDAGLTREEIDIALLLIEGKSRSEITRKLRIKSDDANKQMESIRNKLIGANDPDPNITAVANRYNLTGREKDMLRCLCRNMTNTAIAAEMFLSEGTVRIHVRNLIKKLPVDDRHDAASWVSTFEK
jgi:DNA-binding CsgD family transcriptional regulator